MLTRQVGQPGAVPNQGGMMNNPNAGQQTMTGAPGGGPQQQFPNAMATGGGPGGMMMVNQAGTMMTAGQGQMMAGPGGQVGPGHPVNPSVMAVPRGPMTSTAGPVTAQQQMIHQQRMNQQRLAMLRAQQHQQAQQQQQQQSVPISQAGIGNQPQMMTAGPPHPQSMQARPPFQGGVQGGGGPVMGGSSVGGVVAPGGNVVPAANVPMNTLSTVTPSPSNQMSMQIRSPANYNHLLPSPTGGTNYQNIQSPASNNFQGEGMVSIRIRLPQSNKRSD